jgi:lysyl-tRNA synthetase class 2
MYLTNNPSIQEVLLFPQMKPEKQEKKLDLKDNEKVIFDIISKENSMILSDLKSQAGLSGKGWDKGIKALGKMNLVKVTKTDDVLTVSVM